MTEYSVAYYDSPLGFLGISGSEEGVSSVSFIESVPARFATPKCLGECVHQLDEYFNSGRKEFSLSLNAHGTEFQKRVWSELQRIPYGQTVSYRDIACAIGSSDAVRAVGSANGRNPLSIIVPCHRVIGSDGSLTGYGGGLRRKEWLLNFEHSLPQLRLLNSSFALKA